MTFVRSLTFVLIASTAMAFAGCGYTETTPGEEVDVTGTVTGVDLKSAKKLKLKLHLMPTGGVARPAQFPLDETGKFSGKVIKGPYRFQINGPDGSDSVMPGFPEEYQKGDMNRKIEITGGNVEIKF